MSYIKIIDKDEAEGPVKEIYDELIEKHNGRLPLVLRCMSLHPEAITAVSALNSITTFGGSALTRPQEEMSATVTALINECDY